MNIASQFSQVNPIVLYAVIIWSLVWKGLSLWRAAQQKQRNWFIAILVLNTIGLLEIIYLFFFSKKRMQMSELKFWESSR